MVFASLKKIANWPAFLVKLLYIITLPIVFIRLLLTKIPIIQDIVFWFFIPEISNDEKQDPIAYRRAMLEIEKQFDAGVGVDIRHFYIKVDDDVYLHAAAAGSQTKPLMLFLHGFPEFWYTWRHLLKEFSKDYYCVAIDQRGYNISSKPKKFTDYAQYYMICDVEKVVQDLGFNHCILVAHDWGGCIAWHVAHCFDFVDQLIVMNMPHPSAMSKALQSTPQQRKSVYMLYFQIPMLPDNLLSKNGGEAVANLIANQLITTPATAGDKAAFAHAACRPGAMTGALNWYRAVFGGRVKKWRAKQLEQPVLFLYGTGDVAFDMESVLPATERYCKNLTTITIDRCSHWTQNDQPKIVIKHMKAFLDKHRAE